MEQYFSNTHGVAALVVDFKKHVHKKKRISISKSALVRFSITNYIEHKTRLKYFVIDF